MHVKPYLQAISSDAGAPDGRCYYEKAYSLHELSDDLIALKNRYGPTNVFRFNQNIQPTI